MNTAAYEFETPTPLWPIEHRRSIVVDDGQEQEKEANSAATDGPLSTQTVVDGEMVEHDSESAQKTTSRKHSFNRPKPRSSKSHSVILLEVPSHSYIQLKGEEAETGGEIPLVGESNTIPFTKRDGDGDSRTNDGDSDDSSSEYSLSRTDRCQQQVHDFITAYKSTITTILYTLLALAYLVYFVIAVVMDAGRATALLVGTVAFPVLMVARATWRRFRDTFAISLTTCGVNISKNGRWFKRVVFAVLLSAFILFLALDVAKQPRNLVSLGGFVTYVLLLFITSKHPGKVNWRPVLTGISLQFCLGIFILRVPFGFHAFHFLGEQMQAFFKYSDYGAQFIFGKAYEAHFFAFKILPVIVYFSTAISIVYYLGAMQVVTKAVARTMMAVMGTTVAESVNAVANIFLGQWYPGRPVLVQTEGLSSYMQRHAPPTGNLIQNRELHMGISHRNSSNLNSWATVTDLTPRLLTEAPLLIKSFLPNMTRSELHAVMTGGFATIAGGIMAAYIGFGIPASHLIAASVMTAPGALAVSKLFYPESEVSKMKDVGDIQMPKGNERNIIEAASAGASASIKIVSHIAANLLGFLGILQFVNAILSYFGSLVDVPQLSFELICSYIFRPCAFLMGVEWSDCGLVAELLGTKTFMNEFIAYDRLGEFITNRESGTCSQDYPCMSIRSETITTYALCGFANLSSIGVAVGGLGAMAPSRKSELAGLAVHALIAGTVACFMSACIAGLLISDPGYSLTPGMSINVTDGVNTTLSNLTALNL